MNNEDSWCDMIEAAMLHIKVGCTRCRTYGRFDPS